MDVPVISSQPPPLLVSPALTDLLTPGFAIECDPGEAESLGAFSETALSAEDALDANADLGGVVWLDEHGGYHIGPANTSDERGA